jgi:outer membrane protein assembly factor BamD (BamD/ComL family)
MQDENDRYKIALLQLSNGDHDVGIANLEQIISLYPDSIQARKSVFVLAKYYRNEKQYDRAINYYNKYMSNYPEQEFFVQKSMQGILDCLISLGDVNLAEKTANSLADLVNGIADPRSVFDASENLFVKGQYQLANSTFLFGLSAANKFINNSHSEYERNLTRLHMIRSAYSLGKMEIANDASQAAIADLVAYMATPVNVTEKSDYLYSQILLWAAKIANDFEDYSKSRGFLEIFLHRYPDHKDTDYAKFQLVRIMMRRWEIDNIRITDISNRTHVHNKNLAFILQSGVLDTVKNLIQTINVVEFKKEAAQWTEYLQ